jgi:hypothetical protein
LLWRWRLRDARRLSPIRRVNFFDGQLLSAADLREEQEYHRRMRYLHNRVFHGWGVAEGLEVSIDLPTRVQVSPGVALDRGGHEIVLEEPLYFEIGSEGPDDPDSPPYVTARWDELPDEIGPEGNTRWLEWHDISMTPDPPKDPGIELVLARVVAHGGAIQEIDVSERRELGAS